jgi:chromosome segregation protein
VVQTEAEAHRAIQALRQDEAGQATFVVLDRLPTPPSVPEAPADTQVLRDQVRVTDDTYTALADVLLHNDFLAETLDSAQKAADAASDAATIYAPTGEWSSTHGRMRGGSRQEHASPVASRVGRREQLAEAEAEWEAAHDQCETLKAERNGARADFEQAESDLDDARTAVNEAQRAYDRAESRVEQATQEQDDAESRRDELADRMAERAEELSELRTEIDTVRTAVKEADDTLQELRRTRQDAESELGRAAEAEREAVEAHNDAQLAAVEARNHVQSLERELERLHEQRDEIAERIEERSARADDLSTTISDAQTARQETQHKLEQARAKRQDYQDAVDAAESALQETRNQVSEVEQTLRALRQDRESAVQKENKAAVRRAEIDTRLEELQSAIAEDFDRDLDDDPVELPDDFDVGAAQDRVRSLRGKRNQLGNVNPLAVDEYAETKDRLDFLTEQQEDLEEAEDTLLETISEINAKASERFEATYASVRESFQKLFTDLFGDAANAELVLADADDPLDAPIEIHAQPPGKRPSTLEQLSSGEKTLTAIALLFAIYLVKPSPFCILDEVDAPLDDTNVERFMNLIRRFEQDTQFILVTHNQRTMALADRMYGVTMQENGVSELVGVEFDEAVELAG